jgi:hypothetical protein
MSANDFDDTKDKKVESETKKELSEKEQLERGRLESERKEVTLSQEYRDLLDNKCEMISVRDADELNEQAFREEFQSKQEGWVKEGLSQTAIEGKTTEWMEKWQPPWKEGTQVIEARLKEDATFDRFHLENEPKEVEEGKRKPPEWMCLDGSDNRPLVMQHEYAIPDQVPTHHSQVEVDKDSVIRVGIVNEYAVDRSGETPKSLEKSPAFIGRHEPWHVDKGQVQVVSGDRRFLHTWHLEKEKMH